MYNTYIMMESFYYNYFGKIVAIYLVYSLYIYVHVPHYINDEIIAVILFSTRFHI